ncbi:MAG: LamG domain-containing protein [bacterium]|nr:LamG domain-containing protein [bacterium]
MTRFAPLALFTLLLATTDAARAQSACGSLLFDGTDDIATVLNSSGDFDMGSALTIEAWVRTDNALGGATWVGATTPPGAGAWQIGAGVTAPSDALIVVATPQTSAAVAAGAVQTGTWQHFAGTYDGSIMRIFVNGAQGGAFGHPSPGPTLTIGNLIFGRFPVSGSSLFFNGALDEVRVWNVVRTPAQIQQSFMQELNGNEAGLVGYYKFDEPGGNVILDSSTAGNNGFLGAAAGPAPDDPTRIPDSPPFIDCALGASYCGPSVPNSSGFGATISAAGSPQVAVNNVTLTAVDLPVSEFGYFITGQTQGFFSPPGSQGFICLTGTIGRYNQIANIIQGPVGTITIDLNAIPVTPPIAVTPGETWNFQCWFRDNNPNLTSNFTDGLSIGFQ